MAKLLAPYLFKWQEVEARSDLERLRLVLDHLPDEALMKKLEAHRDKGRDDYPIRPVWNSVLAGIVYQHGSVESLRRELSRNGELREGCGFDPHKGSVAVPPCYVYTRFLKLLIRFKSEMDAIFDTLVETLKGLVSELGFSVAVDSKGVSSAGRPTKETGEDGRRDTDADWGKKTYRGQREDGTLWEKMVKWFGYKIHLIVDTTYEMPIGYRVTRASESDTKQLMPMVRGVKEKHLRIYKDMQRLTADKAYDSEENCRDLYDEHGIKPVIDIRRIWRDKETKLVDARHADNIVYDEAGKVYCLCPVTLEQRPMAYGGFEKHFIRGQKKMELRVGLALCVMLAMALGRIKEQRRELMRSLVRTPAPLDKAA